MAHIWIMQLCKIHLAEYKTKGGYGCGDSCASGGFLSLACRDLRSLDGLSSLRTLVLDDNLLQSHVVFPLLPCLEHLWVNKNSIVNLPVFIETVAGAFPCLKHLSMMNNPAAPSYFNGGSVESYRDYR